jgi:hypothetical protein
VRRRMRRPIEVRDGPSNSCLNIAAPGFAPLALRALELVERERGKCGLEAIVPEPHPNQVGCEAASVRLPNPSPPLARHMDPASKRSDVVPPQAELGVPVRKVFAVWPPLQQSRV